MNRLATFRRVLETLHVVSPFDAFETADATAINTARLEHLASLGLELDRKTVLEVGAGVGLLTHFFEERRCTMLSTDGNPQNVDEIRKRFPHRRVQVLDLDQASDLSNLGRFQVVFCYGTLYHLSRPEQALIALATTCDEMILLETCVALGAVPDIHFLLDPPAHNQAVSGVGCRPTRSWVMEKLNKHFGFAYVTRTQPKYRDFVLNWRTPPTQLLYRSIFVGSKNRINNSNLLDALPAIQTSS